MAIFSNQATLTYNGNTTTSNIAYGEILDVLRATKTAVEGSYTPGSRITYVVTLRNTGTAPLTGLTLTDNLGGYVYNGVTVYPLVYTADSVRVFVGGTPQSTPTVTAGPPMVISGLSVPAGGDTVIVYQADATAYAPPTLEGTVINTATISGTGLGSQVTAQATVTASTAPRLAITKSVSPAQVVENDRVTYTFVIQNYGSVAVDAADSAAITDTFDPILTALTVTFAGEPWAAGTQYTYNQATGLFSTIAGQLTVPAATITQDASGAYTITPGTATLTVTGTI